MAGFPDIKEISPNGWADGILGFVTPEVAQRLAGTHFECGDTDYSVHRMNYGVYRVNKFDGFEGEIYDLNLSKNGWTCNCRSGRQHRDCRHKEMVCRVERKKGNNK